MTRLIDADALVWKIMTLCRSYQKTHLVHAEMLETFTNSVLAYIDHAEEHKTEVKVIQYDSNLSAEPNKSTDHNRADVPIGETISRADAIEVGNKIVEELALSSLDWDSLKYWAKELFDALPSADRPQVNSNSAEEQIAETCDRPKGEWKWTHGGQCSECGFHNTNFDFNFCPNCGARMKGGAE